MPACKIRVAVALCCSLRRVVQVRGRTAEASKPRHYQPLTHIFKAWLGSPARSRHIYEKGAVLLMASVQFYLPAISFFLQVFLMFMDGLFYLKLTAFKKYI